MSKSAVLVHGAGVSRNPSESVLVGKLAVGAWKGKDQDSSLGASYFNDMSHSESSSRQEER